MMTLTRAQRTSLQKNKIIEATEQLLLDDNEEIVISDVAEKLGIAKGTIYRYFRNKNHLYLELLIMNEKRLLEISKQDKEDITKSITNYMLYHLNNANMTILFHNIEEKITFKEKDLKSKFQELYSIREQRILEVKDITSQFLQSHGSLINVRDYLSYVWTITFGACLLLNSSCYQKSVGRREELINFYIKQALNI